MIYILLGLPRSGKSSIVDSLLKPHIKLNVYGHFVDTSPEECERRAIACGQNDLVDKGVIRNMAENFRNMHPNFRLMFNIKATWI